ncbi:MAG: phosphatase PAP2 family protein [Candidatus Neomarinimicrobiota bacterium]
MKRRIGFAGIALLFCLSASTALPAEMPDPLRQPVDYIRWYPNHYWNGFKGIADVRFHRNLLIAGAVAIPVAFLLDDAVRDYTVKYGLYSSGISRIGDLYGYPWGYIGAVGLVTLTGVTSRQPFQKTFSDVELLGEAIITEGIIVGLVKEILHRQRPNGANFHSFPSGHTSGSFTLAACLDEIYGKKVGIPAYAMAAFVASSRINDNKHYLSDVVTGAVVGTIIGKSFSREHHRMWHIQANQSHQTSTVSISCDL